MSSEQGGQDARANAGGGDQAIRVLIVEHDPAVRRTLRLTAERSGIEVVGEAADGNAAIALAARLRPDVALLDCCMREPDCVEAARRLHAGASVGAAVLLDIYREYEAEARAAGLPYLLKDAPLDDLVAAIREAAARADPTGGRPQRHQPDGH